MKLINALRLAFITIKNYIDTTLPLKLDIHQGVANSGKIMGVDEEGNLVPVDNNIDLSGLETKTDAQVKLDEAIAYTDEQIENHTHSYNDLEDRTHYDTRESEDIIIEWDGDTSNKIVVYNNYYKVSDVILTNEQIKNGAVTMCDGREIEISPIWSNFEQMGLVADDFCVLEAIIITRKDNVTISNGDSSITVEEAGVYFAYVSFDEFDYIMYPTSLKCVQSSGELKQLDEKFIPDSVKAQADWNVNDENDPAYVKNRTHYSEKSEDVVLLDNTYTDFNADGTGLYGTMPFVETNTTLTAGQQMKVTWDDAEYNTMVQLIDNYILFGNLHYYDSSLEDTGEPFVVMCFGSTIAGIMTKDEGTTHKITIALSGHEHVVPIDVKYLINKPGLKTTGNSYVIDSETYTASNGAEIFNDYVSNIAIGKNSHAEGTSTTASGSSSHAEGSDTTASGMYSHAEGYGTTASGNYSHAEGYNTTASGKDSHAEGNETTASGSSSYAEGIGTVADRAYMHASGRFNKYEDDTLYVISFGRLSEYIELKDNQVLYVADTYEFDATTGIITLVDPITVDTSVTDKETLIGKWMSLDSCYDETTHATTTLYKVRKNAYNTICADGYYSLLKGEVRGKYVHVVGNGTGDDTRSNAHTLDWEGNAEYKGDIIANACGGENPVSLLELAEKVNSGSGSTQSDWNVNDENNPAYVKNRPFYITDPQPVEVISDKFTTVPGMNGVYANLIEFSSNVDFQIGDKTKVIFDGVEYDNLLVKSLEETSNSGYIGNGSIISTMYAEYNMFAGLEDTGETFMILVDIGFNEGVMAFSMSDSEHQITLISYKPQYKPIPYEFLGIPIKNGNEFCSILINDVKNNKAPGKYSYAEGCMTSAVGNYSHSEGQGTKAIGNMSHAEGCGTQAHGRYSHAEGYSTKTDGENAHAEGLYNQANGANSHASGERNIANKKNCFVFGKHNVYEEKGATYTDTLFNTVNNISEEDEYYMSDSYTFDVETGKYTLVDPILVKGSEIVDANKYIISRFRYDIDDFDSINQTVNDTASGRYVIIRQAVHYSEIEGQYVHIVGNGENGSKRSNAHTLDWNGNAEFQGDVIAHGCGGEAPVSLLEMSRKLDSLINGNEVAY